MVGALARHADVERDEAAYDVLPLLRQALRLVAHPVIRNRGTTVGSLAHADPSGEMTAVLALTGGTVEVARRGSSAGRRRRRTSSSARSSRPCAAGELAVSASFPALPARTGTTFVEVARRHGDYAVCGVAAAVTLDDDGAVTSARAGLHLGGTDAARARPHRGGRGAAGGDADWAAAGELAAGRPSPRQTSTPPPTTAATWSGADRRALAEAAGRAA